MRNPKVIQSAVIVVLAMGCQVLLVASRSNAHNVGTDSHLFAIQGWILYAACLGLVFIWAISRPNPGASYRKPLLWSGVLTLAFYLTASFCIAMAVNRISGNDFIRKYITSLTGADLPIRLTLAGASAVWEEAVYRDALFEWLAKRMHAIFAMMISVLAFLCLHSKIDFFLVLLSVALAINYFQTKSLAICIVIHFAHNLSALASEYNFAQLAAYNEVEKFGVATIHLCLPILGILALAFNMFIFRFFLWMQRRKDIELSAGKASIQSQ